MSFVGKSWSPWCWPPNHSRIYFFSSTRRHTRLQGDWSSDVCSSDLLHRAVGALHTICQDHLGSVDLQQSFSFRTSIVRKADGDANARGGSKHGVRDSGITADRKSVGVGKGVDLGGRRVFKINKKKVV